jgi:hypothetical protein
MLPFPRRTPQFSARGNLYDFTPWPIILQFEPKMFISDDGIEQAEIVSPA